MSLIFEENKVMIDELIIFGICFLCQFINSLLGMGFGTLLTPILLFVGYHPLEVVPAILYADLVTNSMTRAINETDRRRKKQVSYNQINNITPIGVKKDIREMIDGIYKIDAAREELKNSIKFKSYDSLSTKQLTKEIKRLDKSMIEHAKNLEFEKAADVRDKIQFLKEKLFGTSGTEKIVSIAK